MPSSFNKICCNTQTCSKEKNATSSLPVMYMRSAAGNDEDIQMPLEAASPSAQTLIPTKTSEKSTEAYFDGNNENISSYLNEICSSNSTATTLTESQTSAAMLKHYPSAATAKKIQPQPVNRSLPRCTCRQINITPSSSCSSLSSVYLQEVKRHSSKQKRPQYRFQRIQRNPNNKEVNISHDQLLFFASRPERAWELLQGFEKLSTSFGLQPKTVNFLSNELKNNVTSYDEEFYSCSSEDSEVEENPDNLHDSEMRSSTDRNYTILQLLQEIANLISKDSTIRKTLEAEEAPSGESGHHSHIKLRPLDEILQPTTTTQAGVLLWPPQTCFCNCPGHMPPSNFFLPHPPYNLTAPALDRTVVNEPFVYEENTSFRVSSNGSRNLLTTDQLVDNEPGACLAAPDPMEYGIQSPCSPLAAANNIKMAVAIQTSESLCWKQEVATEMDALNKQNLGEEANSFKDCSSGRNSILTADQLPAHLICKCFCNQMLLQDRYQTFHFSCVPAAESKNNDGMAQVCPKSNLDTLQKNVENEKLSSCCPPFGTSSDEVEFASVAETLSSGLYQSCSDGPMDYDDGQPHYKDKFAIKDEVNSESGKGERPVEFSQTADLVNSMPHNELTELAKSEEYVKPEHAGETAEFTELLEEKTLKNIANSKLETLNLSYNKDDGKKLVDITGEMDAPSDLKKEETSSFTDYNTAIVAQNIYNLLAENNYHQDSKQLSANEYSAEDAHKLTKEELAKDLKTTKPDETGQLLDKETHLATQKQEDAEGCCTEMVSLLRNNGVLLKALHACLKKFFIDSLILDLEAMDQTRCRSMFDKNICNRKKLADCTRNSFPVTITDVTDLGSSSLYMKWKIHDCCGIAGYEIFTDGYLTNRFYNSRHDAAVITQVDITVPHRIALVALPEASNECWDFICNMNKTGNKTKPLPWRTSDESQSRTVANLWTPSIFLYDPNSERTSAALEC